MANRFLALIGVVFLAGCGVVTAAKKAETLHTQQRVVAAPTLLPIYADDFSSGTSRSVLEASSPSDEGSSILRDEIMINATVMRTVEQRGIPDALELDMPNAWLKKGIHFSVSSGPYISLYYRKPAHTVVIDHSGYAFFTSGTFDGSILGEINEVPRSVRMCAFGESGLQPPWPVTISSELYRYMDVPSEIDAPPADIDGTDYAPVSAQIIEDVHPLQSGTAFQRATRAFASLKNIAASSGVDWRLYVYDAESPAGYGVPDGSIFVTNALVDRLDDAELTAVLAHLMGHERYQHARAAAWRHNVTTIAALLVGPPIMLYGAVGSAMGGGEDFLKLGAVGFKATVYGASAPFMNYLEILTYKPIEEVEANSEAVLYLAQLGIPPEVLIDGLRHADSHAGTAEIASLRFGEMHRVARSALEFGKALDAGMVRAASR